MEKVAILIGLFILLFIGIGFWIWAIYDNEKSKPHNSFISDDDRGFDRDRYKKDQYEMGAVVMMDKADGNLDGHIDSDFF